MGLGAEDSILPIPQPRAPSPEVDSIVIRRKRLALALGGALALLALVAAVAAVATWRRIDLPRLREQVVALLSPYVAGSVEIQALRVSLLPLPHVVLDGVSLSQPGTAEVKIASVSVYPELLPLLQGRVQPSTITIVAPDVRLDRVALRGADEGDRPPDVSECQGACPVLPALNLSVVVQGGQLRFVAAPSVAVTDVDARVDLQNQQASFDLTGTSTLAEQIAFRGAVGSAQASVDARITNIDVTAARAAAGGLTDEVPAVSQLFAILRSGRVALLTLHSEAASLADLGGEALTIGATVDGAQVHIPGADLDLQDVGGDVEVRAGVLAGKHLVARLGGSHARDGTLRLGLGAAPSALSVETTVEADAADLVALLKRLGGGTLAAALDRVGEVQGEIGGKLTLGGTTTDVAVTADVAQVQMSAQVQGLKDRLHVAGGRLSYAAQRLAATDLTLGSGGSKASRLSLSSDWGASPAHLAVTLRDAKVELAQVYPWLAASGWLAGASWAPQTLAGTLVLSSVEVDGPATIPAQWRFEGKGAVDDLAIESAALRQWTNLSSGVSLAAAHVVRDSAGRLSASGTFHAPDSRDGAVDLVWNNDELRISKLSIRDAQSQATLALLLKGRALDLTFDGRLSGATLDAIVANNPLHAGWISGKLRSQIPLDEPLRLIADGHLEAGDVRFPIEGQAPLHAETLALDAQGGSVVLRAVLLTQAQSRLQVVGTVTPSPQAMVVDLDVSGGALDRATIESFLPRPHQAAQQQGSATVASNPPLRGTIRLAADSFAYGDFIWKPLQGTVLFAADATTVKVTDAVLCGIATPGVIAVLPAGLDVAFQLRAQQALDQTLACLAAEEGLITGQYTLKGDVAGRGPLAELAKSLKGEVVFEATRGRIYRTQVAKTLLSVLSVATGSVFNIADMTKDGLEYEGIVIEGTLRGRTLQLRKIVLTAPSATMVGEGSVDVIGQTLDLTLLVAPLRSVDKVVSHIPLLGTALGGTLVSIPVRVSGPLSDPTVTPMAVTAVGGRLRGFMESTTKLPVKIFQRFRPERK